MPIFEYKCDKCGTIKDLIKSYSKRNEDTPCEDCKGTLHYIDKIQPGSFALKGSGWYKTGGY